MYVGMELLGTVSKISEIGITVVLPNSFTGQVPITEISDPLTAEVQEALAKEGEEDGEDSDADDDDKKDKGVKLPDLKEMFTLGQIVRVQTTVVPTVEAKSAKIKLTMDPKKINKSLRAADLEPGLVRIIYFRFRGVIFVTHLQYPLDRPLSAMWPALPTTDTLFHSELESSRPS